MIFGRQRDIRALMPRWHNLVLRRPGKTLPVSLFPSGFPSSNLGRGVFFLKKINLKKLFRNYKKISEDFIKEKRIIRRILNIKKIKRC